MVTNLESANIEEELIRIKLKKGELNADQTFILDSQVAGKDCLDPHEKTKEVYETLLNSPIREDGGRNALFGFYYQFLVAIDYLVELIEGKWSFMAFEIHDDIVLCKEDPEQQCVRFVQVKTSKNPSQSFTSTELCKRSEKKFNVADNEIKKRINDSWLDKLFFNAELFKGKEEITNQFQLITNFTFHVPIPNDSETKNINHYRENKAFLGVDIKDDDPFYKKLRDPVFNQEGNEYNYNTQTGMSVRDMLSKTQISEQVDHLSSFRDGIRTRLGDILSQRVMTEGGATILDEDINWLIGEMIANCSAREDKLVLFIDREKAMYLENKLLERAVKYSENLVEIIGNKNHIDEAFNRFIQEVQHTHPEAIEYMEDLAVPIKQQFYRWVDGDGGNILQMVGKFHQWREESIDFHARMHKSQREDSIYAIIVTFLLLKMTNKDINFSSKYKNILTKEIFNSLEEVYDLALLKIDDNYYYEEVVSKLNEIITRLHVHSHSDLLLMTIDAPSKVIIHGSHDSFDSISFNKSSMETISLDSPEIPELGENANSMSKVNYRFLLIPWYVIESKYARFRRNKEDVTIFNASLKELWDKLIKEGE